MGAWEAHIAIRNGNIPILKEHLILGKLNLDIRFRDETLLCSAINHNQPIIAQLLLDFGANPNLKSKQGGRNEPPLITATRLKNLKIVQILLEKGADIHSTNFYGVDAMFQAVVENAFEILEYLLQQIAHGSSPHKDRKSCQLILAIQHCSYPLKKKCLFLLLKYNYLCPCFPKFSINSTTSLNLNLNEIFDDNEFQNKTLDQDVVKLFYLSKGVNIAFVDELRNSRTVSVLLPLKLNLMNLARIQIRQSVSNRSWKMETSFATGVLKLPLPPKLINFVLMKAGI